MITEKFEALPSVKAKRNLFANKNPHAVSRKILVISDESF